MKKAYLFAASLLISICAHAFFLKEWAEGRYMTGPGDGLAQMIVFKKMLFEQYMQGNFFTIIHLDLAAESTVSLAIIFLFPFYLS